MDEVEKVSAPRERASLVYKILFCGAYCFPIMQNIALIHPPVIPHDFIFILKN
jgi:hypothetical protein